MNVSANQNSSLLGVHCGDEGAERGAGGEEIPAAGGRRGVVVLREAVLTAGYI